MNSTSGILTDTDIVGLLRDSILHPPEKPICLDSPIRSKEEVCDMREALKAFEVDPMFVKLDMPHDNVMHLSIPSKGAKAYGSVWLGWGKDKNSDLYWWPEGNGKVQLSYREGSERVLISLKCPLRRSWLRRFLEGLMLAGVFFLFAVVSGALG